MSTRCQLGVYEDDTRPLKEWDVLLYRHFDGYPQVGKSGVLPDITEFLRDFIEKRGGDSEYLGAQLMHHMIKTTNGRMGKIGKYADAWVNDYTGYGICKAIHGYIEFFYRITPTRIIVYQVDDPGTMDTWKKIKTVLLQRKNKQKEDR